jgi:hypothetical protein
VTGSNNVSGSVTTETIGRLVGSLMKYAPVVTGLGMNPSWNARARTTCVWVIGQLLPAG